MVKHIHQDYLLSCKYKTIKTEELKIPWNQVAWLPDFREPRELLDGIQPLTRKISVSLLAQGPSTLEEWNAFVPMLQGIGRIVLVDDRPVSKLPFVAQYAKSALQAFVYRLQQAGIAVSITMEAA